MKNKNKIKINKNKAAYYWNSVMELLGFHTIWLRSVDTWRYPDPIVPL